MLSSGEGSVITGRFTTRQVDIIARAEILGADGTIEILEGTTTHPVWSLDRQDWVELGELAEGEQLSGQAGIAVVLSLTIHRCSTPVYNIEVHGEHVYEVGRLALLVHNNGVCGIYEFTAASGLRYVGQCSNIANRIRQHVASGRLLPNNLNTVNQTLVNGGKTAREIAEQLRINALGGITNLNNLVNPIGSARRHLLS